MRPVRFASWLAGGACAIALGWAGCGGGQKTAVIPAEPVPAEPVEPVEPVQPVEPAEPAAPALVWPEEPYRAERPAVGPARPLQLPEMQTFDLKSGVKIYLVERHDLPTLTVDLVFDGGSIDDPKGKTGLAGMCMATVGDSTEKLEKAAFEEALADMASSVSTWAGLDQKGIALGTLSKYADPTWDLWADVLLHPGLRQADWDRNLKQTLIGIEQAKKVPASAAARVNNGVLYGVDHVYSGVTTKASVEALKLDDCKKWVKTYLQPKGAKLFVVGDVTRKDLEAKLGARLGDWKGKPKAASKVGKAKPRKGRIFFVDTPGATQAQVRIMHIGPGRKSPDYYANTMLSAILGGSFTSRINMNLREDKGWSYGARGGFGYTREVGAFSASAPVRADATKGAIVELVKEIRGVVDADVSNEELVREKNGQMLALPGWFASGRQALAQYRGLLYFGLPLDYYAGYTAAIDKVTIADLRAAAKKYLKLDDAKLLVVGDAKIVGPMLDEILAEGTFGKDPIVKLDADGNEVK